MPEKKKRVDSSTGRANPEECLPQDVLNEIMGYLDRETLCSSRLVSKAFCAAASARVCSLTLASTSEAVSFHRYPHLEHVTVEHAYPRLNEVEKSLAQLEPYLQDLATTLTITHCYWAGEAQTRDYLSQAALMPKLRKLEVKGGVEHEAALLACCSHLEAMKLMGCSISVARAIVTMTRLTSLQIDNVRTTTHHARPEYISWLGHATNLRSLRALAIPTPEGALPLIGNVTGLTGLTVCPWSWEGTSNFAPLTRLTRLKSLCISWGITESDLEIACSLGLGSLVNLYLRVEVGAPADCGRLLERQTALTQLSLCGWQLCNLRHIGALRIELLRSLEICSFDTLDAEGLSVLSRATTLTKFSLGAPELQGSLSRILGGLTQLRSLRISARRNSTTDILDLPLALSPLTGLTELNMTSLQDLDDGVMRALLVLTGLRVLELSHCRLTPAKLPDLGGLTNLSVLRALRCGVTSLAPLSEVLDPLRKARGLPPLQTGWYDI